MVPNMLEDVAVLLAEGTELLTPNRRVVLTGKELLVELGAALALVGTSEVLPTKPTEDAEVDVMEPKPKPVVVV